MELQKVKVCNHTEPLLSLINYQATPWDNFIHTLQSVPLSSLGFTFYNSEVKWNAAARRHKSLQDDNNVF